MKTFTIAALLLSAVAGMSHALEFQQVKAVHFVIRCNTELLATTIVDAYSSGRDAGQLALTEAMSTRSKTGKVNCNPVGTAPLFIRSAVIVRTRTVDVRAPIVPATNHVIQVSSSAFPSGPFDESFLIVSKETLDYLFGTQY